MKATFIYILGITIFTMLSALTSTAQKTGRAQNTLALFPAEVSGNSHTETRNMDISENSEISAKLSNRFNKIFDDATNVKWYEADGNFLAKFKTGSTSHTSLFNKNGKLIYSIAYYSENQLPPDARRLIADRYENHTVTNIVKVLQDNRKIWVIKLAGKNDYVTVRLEDGEMEEVENFHKL